MTTTPVFQRLVAGTALSLLALAAIGCTADESAHPPTADIDRGWKCEMSSDGTVRALGSVTNHSSEESFYVLDIDFAVDGRAHSSTTETVDEVDPGETARIESAVYNARRGNPTCVVSDVNRFKA